MVTKEYPFWAKIQILYAQTQRSVQTQTAARQQLPNLSSEILGSFDRLPVEPGNQDQKAQDKEGDD